MNKFKTIYGAVNAENFYQRKCLNRNVLRSFFHLVMIVFNGIFYYEDWEEAFKKSIKMVEENKKSH